MFGIKALIWKDAILKSKANLQIRQVKARAAKTAWTVQPKMLVRSSLPQLELLQMASLLVNLRSISLKA